MASHPILLIQKVLDYGFNSLENNEKDQFVMFLARNDQKPLVDITVNYILEAIKKFKIQAFKQKCEETILNGFTASNGHFYRTNRDDQINMLGQKEQLMEDETIEVIPWKTEDAGYINHTREEWLQVYKEGFDFKRATLFKYNDLKQRIENAKTDEELASIKWDDESGQ